MDICGGRSRYVRVGGVAGSIERCWSVDDLDVETSAKGLKMRDNQVMGNHMCGGQKRGELGETHGGDNGHDVGVV